MRIVLVGPRDPNNIGAVARAMANFGLYELVVVSPWPPTWDEVKSAVGADEVIASARVVGSVAEAIAGCTYVGAATAGARRRLTRVATPRQFAEAVASCWDESCLLFGNEKSGLPAKTIAAAHVAVRVPTVGTQPSMNLSQAVAVCCYELGTLTNRGVISSPARLERLATVDEIERLVAAAALSTAHPDATSRRLCALLLRARVSRGDIDLLWGLLAHHSADTLA